MSDSPLVGLDGRPLEESGDIVSSPAEYMEHLGRRSGMDFRKREFLKANLPKITDAPPDHMSKSQRTIVALRDALTQVSIQNLQLFGLLGAFCEKDGGESKFDQKHLAKFTKPAEWPVVVVDPDGMVVVKLGQFKDNVEAPPSQLPLPLDEPVD